MPGEQQELEELRRIEEMRRQFDKEQEWYCWEHQHNVALITELKRRLRVLECPENVKQVVHESQSIGVSESVGNDRASENVSVRVCEQGNQTELICSGQYRAASDNEVNSDVGICNGLRNVSLTDVEHEPTLTQHSPNPVMNVQRTLVPPLGSDNVAQVSTNSIVSVQPTTVTATPMGGLRVTQHVTNLIVSTRVSPPSSDSVSTEASLRDSVEPIGLGC